MQTIDLQRLQLAPHHTLLDLGCGQGRHALAAHFFSPAEQVIAVDLNLADLRTAQGNLASFASPPPRQQCHLLAADGINLPFADDSFDAVICSEVLEHVPQYEQMLREINRILKPGGVFAVSVPRAWPERICWWLSRAYHQVEGGHIRIFKCQQLREQIEQYSFIYQQRHWAHALHVPYWWLRCLFWRFGENFPLVRWYHRFLVWDLMQKPRVTRWLETGLNPMMGKSIVMYFLKPSLATGSSAQRSNLT